MSSNTYWKAHFVIMPDKEEYNGTSYHGCGICEVHYEDDKPIMWTQNFQSPDWIDDNMDDALKEASSLIKLYLRALTECVYIVRKKEDGTPYLDIYHERFQW